MGRKSDEIPLCAGPTSPASVRRNLKLVRGHGYDRKAYRRIALIGHRSPRRELGLRYLLQGPGRGQRICADAESLVRRFVDMAGRGYDKAWSGTKCIAVRD